jgi:hypothetical protein
MYKILQVNLLNQNEGRNDSVHGHCNKLEGVVIK